MELHERIFEQRRKAGLSQEGLAGKLNVSRQAVGKWENGTSTPDINNLIELSKVFGISLSALLGLEEPDNLVDNETSRKELENFLKHYAYEQSQQAERYESVLREHEEQEAGRRKTQNILLCVVVAAAIIFGIVAGKRISGLNDRLTALQSDTQYSISRLSNNIYSMQDSITGLLKAQASLFSDFSYDVTAYDAESGEVTVSMSATPKNVSDGTQVEFVLTGFNGGEYRGTAERDGMEFSSLIEVPSGDYGIQVLVTENGTQTNEDMGSCSASPIGLAAEYYFDWLEGPEYTFPPSSDGDIYHPCGLVVIICNNSNSWPAREITGVEMVLYKNETELKRLSLNADDMERRTGYYEVPEEYLFTVSESISGSVTASEAKPTGFSASADGMLFVYEFDFGEIDVAIGDEMRIEFIVTDELGLVYREREFDCRRFVNGTSSTGSTSGGHLSLDYELYE